MAKKGKQKLDRTDARAPAGPRQEAAADPPAKLKRKQYERGDAAPAWRTGRQSRVGQGVGRQDLRRVRGSRHRRQGGTIKRITERVSPRVFRVVALPAPTEREHSQMYMQRYVPHFPAAAEVVIFDRSCTTALGWSG